MWSVNGKQNGIFSFAKVKIKSRKKTQKHIRVILRKNVKVDIGIYCITKVGKINYPTRIFIS